MKHCPSCQTNYADDTLKFCLQDGTELTTIADIASPTVALGSENVNIPSPPAPTERVNIPVQTAPPTNWEQSQETRIRTLPISEPKKSNTALAVLATALGMLLLFGIIGIGAWLYLSGKEGEVAQNNDNSSNPGNQNIHSNISPNTKATPTPTAFASPTPPKNTNNFENTNTTPPSNFNPEEVKSEVSSRMSAWKASMESGSLDSVMSHYADTLNYYYRSGNTSRSSVRNNKKRAFELYYTFRVNITNMRVTPDTSGQKATVTFNKSWEFEGSDDRSVGTVRAQFQLTKIGDRWYITGEKDL